MITIKLRYTIHWPNVHVSSCISGGSKMLLKDDLLTRNKKILLNFWICGNELYEIKNNNPWILELFFTGWRKSPFTRKKLQNLIYNQFVFHGILADFKLNFAVFSGRDFWAIQELFKILSVTRKNLLSYLKLYQCN